MSNQSKEAVSAAYTDRRISELKHNLSLACSSRDTMYNLNEHLRFDIKRIREERDHERSMQPRMWLIAGCVGAVLATLLKLVW